MGLTAAIDIDEVRQLGGANPALVLQQLRWHLHHLETDWWEAPATEIARVTGLTPKQARAALDKLVQKGAIEREKRHQNRGDHTYSYRPTPPFSRSVKWLVSQLPDRENGIARSGKPRSAQSGNSSSSQREDSPLPPTTDPTEPPADRGAGEPGPIGPSAIAETWLAQLQVARPPLPAELDAARAALAAGWPAERIIQTALDLPADTRNRPARARTKVQALAKGPPPTEPVTPAEFTGHDLPPAAPDTPSHVAAARQALQGAPAA